MERQIMDDGDGDADGSQEHLAIDGEGDERENGWGEWYNEDWEQQGWTQQLQTSLDQVLANLLTWSSAAAGQAVAASTTTSIWHSKARHAAGLLKRTLAERHGTLASPF